MLRHCELWLQYEGNKSLPSTKRCCHVRGLFVRREWTESSCAPVGSRILVTVEGKVNGCAVICRECGGRGDLAAWQRSRGKGRVFYLHVLIVKRPPPLPALFLHRCMGSFTIILYIRSQNCEKRLLASRLSVRPSARNNSAPTGQIFMKFGNWVFFENLSINFKFH
jgi:hypothetical protein